MEFFSKTKAVRLRSHLDKYLVADDDKQTVRQSRHGATRRAKWRVEEVPGTTNLLRLKSCHGHYLTASDHPFLLGMTGKKVLQTAAPPPAPPPATNLDFAVEWEPVRDGFQVKLRTREGKFLRANGGTPPWRNSVTHDVPHSGSTHNWVLWDVDSVDWTHLDDDGDGDGESTVGDESRMSSFSRLSEDPMDSPTSPWSVASVARSPRRVYSSSSFQLSTQYQSGMDYFTNAKSVRLRSHHDKYLVADDDEETVIQDRNGSSKQAKWSVEIIHDGSFVRLKSCFGKYLTASNLPFLLGMTGRKVIQTLPKRLDSSVEWEPVRDGVQLKLKTRYGQFLRANGGLPPWRNSVTHDIPHRTATQDWVLWSVDVLDIQLKKGGEEEEADSSITTDSSSVGDEELSPSPASLSFNSSTFKVSNSFAEAKQHRGPEGRTIYYSLADEEGNVDDEGIKDFKMIFKGNGLEELRLKLEEETGIEDLIVCSTNPLNGNLYPLRLQLPPNNATMHVVVIQSSSKVARDFAQ
ncbi:hypothetical protein Sjap_023781 [Stephania japonica]|uniref:Actin cross-linking n=1 Tax=Stephania japonica TaxID=461633 RepID=A0AAP0ECC3_9MAGN